MDRPIARRLLVAALLVGVLAQALVYRTAMGVNLVLLEGVVLAAAFVVRRPGARIDRADLWIPSSALAFAAFPALRADPALLAFDLLASAGVGAAAVAAIGGAALTRRTVAALAAVVVQGLGFVVAGAAEPIRAADVAAGVGPMRSGLARLGPVLRGLLVALPFVLVFVLLFAAADAVFSRAVSDLFSFEVPLGELPGRVAIAAVAAWIVAGLLVTVGRKAFGPSVSAGAMEAGESPFRWPRLGLTEAIVVLTVVDLLFAVFVGLQVAYLFGDRDTLAASGMTYSEYARRGFFELVVVTFLAGGLIAGLAALVEGRSRVYLAAAVALAGLALVVLASATLRLKLYQDAYGWTELRFYVYAAIAWLGLGALATITLLLGGRMRWLIHALGALFVAVALGVNAVGPQAFVARQDLARAIDPTLVAPGGKTGLDVWYLIDLGPDAVPIMIDALPYVTADERAILDEVLRARARALDRPEVTAWPAWNLAREWAREALDRYAP